MLRILSLIVLNLVIIILVVIAVFVGIRFYSAYTNNLSVSASLFDYRDILVRFNILKEAEWRTFEAPTFTFEHPQNWEPRQRELLGGETELIDLKIPVIFSITKIGANNVIGYSKEELSRRRPASELMLEEDFVIGNRNGTKWIYKQNGLIIYEYILPLTRYVSNGKNVATFILHAESTSKDDGLESQLDRIASTVKFKSDEDYKDPSQN